MIMLSLTFSSIGRYSSILKESFVRLENRLSNVFLLRKIDSNPHDFKFLETISSCHHRCFHTSTGAYKKYHDLASRRKKTKKRMDMLRARLERLDKEDLPTGCILCPKRGDIQIDYKNVRLLSQFVSPHTGRIYGRTLTGLCDKKQKEIANCIRRAQALGFMPKTMKYYEFHNDPKLF